MSFKLVLDLLSGCQCHVKKIFLTSQVHKQIWNVVKVMINQVLMTPHDDQNLLETLFLKQTISKEGKKINLLYFNSFFFIFFQNVRFVLILVRLGAHCPVA